MEGTDVNAIFARAEQAFLGGRLDIARNHLAAVERLAGANSKVFHLRALVEKKAGNLAIAKRAFERAAALEPRDAALAANHANLLADLGEHDAALSRYAAALRIAPGFHDPPATIVGCSFSGWGDWKMRWRTLKQPRVGQAEAPRSTPPRAIC